MKNCKRHKRLLPEIPQRSKRGLCRLPLAQESPNPDDNIHGRISSRTFTDHKLLILNFKRKFWTSPKILSLRHLVCSTAPTYIFTIWHAWLIRYTPDHTANQFQVCIATYNRFWPLALSLSNNWKSYAISRTALFNCHSSHGHGQFWHFFSNHSLQWNLTWTVIVHWIAQKQCFVKRLEGILC